MRSPSVPRVRDRAGSERQDSLPVILDTSAAGLSLIMNSQTSMFNPQSSPSPGIVN